MTAIAPATPSVYRIVEKETTSPIGTQMTVVLAANSRAQLDCRAAHDFAKSVCLQRGFAARGLSATPQLYPVNDEGDTTDAVALGSEPIKEYRGEFRFSIGL